MNDTQEQPSAETTHPQRSRFPWKTLILSGMIIFAVVLAHTFISEIEDRFRNGLDLVMIASYASVALLMLIWFGWFLIFSGWRWWKRIIAVPLLCLVPVGFFKLFRPVHGGDVNFVRFEPIWVDNSEPTVGDLVSQSDGVDLATETDADFPRFLGPDQDAIIRTGFRIDERSFAETEPLWKQPIGKGWSGFAARNGFAVTMEQRREHECVTCYDARSGAPQWVYQHTARHRDSSNLGRVGPRSTPTIHEGYVYAVGAVGNFVCLNGTDGTVVWQVDLNGILGIELAEGTDSDGLTFQYEKDSSLAWGRAGAPLIVDDLVVVPGGGTIGGSRSTLLAFDRATGELRWRGGDEMIGYGSPTLATVAGVEQILIVGETKAMGFDPETGEELWRHERFGRSNGEANTSQVTFVSDNQLLTSKGYPDGGGELISIEQTDGKLIPSSVWSSSRVLKTKLTNPVVHSGHTFAISNGFMECTRIDDGSRVWKRRGRFGHGQILLVGDRLLVHGESGTLYLLNATSDGYQELASFDTIRGVCWNTLCLHGSLLLVRSEVEAACFELPGG